MRAATRQVINLIGQISCSTKCSLVTMTMHTHTHTYTHTPFSGHVPGKRGLVSCPLILNLQSILSWVWESLRDRLKTLSHHSF